MIYKEAEERLFIGGGIIPQNKLSALKDPSIILNLSNEPYHEALDIAVSLIKAETRLSNDAMERKRSAIYKIIKRLLYSQVYTVSLKDVFEKKYRRRR